MLREPRKLEKAEQPVRLHKDKRTRFQMVKLERRIAPTCYWFQSGCHHGHTTKLL